MAIEGLRKLFGIKKSEKKAEKKPQIPEVKTEKTETKSGKKINGATLASAMAAALLIPTATSCVDQDQYVDLPNFDSWRAEQQQYQKQVLELLQQLVQLMNTNNDQNKEYFEKLLNSNTQIISILSSMQGDLSDIKNALSSIQIIMQDMYQNDEELLNKIDVIINGQGSDQEKLDQLIELNKEQNEWLSKIVELQQTTADINQGISDKIDKYFQQYLEGQSSHTELMNQIIAEIKNNGNISQDISNKIDQILNGGGADSAKLDQIIDLLESIDSKLGSLLQEVTELGDNFVSSDGEKLGDILADLVQKFEDHSITSNALAAEILNELKQSNINDEAIMNKIDSILEQLQNQEISDKEALDQITDILSQMNEKLSTALASLAEISTKLDNLYNQNEENRNETYEMLANINNGIGNIDQKMDDIINNQKTGNQISLDILDKIDEAVAQLEQINSKTVTIDQLKEMFGPMFDQIIAQLGDISDGQIDIDQIIEIAESMKPDLTLTNALLETINTTIQNKNFTGEFSDQLNDIADMMNQILGEIQSGNMTEAEGLAQILERLASMEGSLEAIQAAADEINNNFQTFMGQAQNYGQKWTEQFQQLIDGQVNKEMFQAYTDLFTQTAEQAQQAQQERLLAIQAAIENLSGGNGAIDIDELISKLPNYSDILNDIRNAMGDLVTKEDLDKYGQDHSVDLTTTNALLETINTTIQNKNFTVSGGGSGSTDLAEVISAINRIYDNLSNAQFPTREQVQVLLDYVNEIAANTSPDPSNRSALAASTRSADNRRDLFAKVNEYNRMAAEKAGKKATYFAPEFDYSGKNYTV